MGKKDNNNSNKRRYKTTFDGHPFLPIYAAVQLNSQNFCNSLSSLHNRHNNAIFYFKLSYPCAISELLFSSSKIVLRNDYQCNACFNKKKCIFSFVLENDSFELLITSFFWAAFSRGSKKLILLLCRWIIDSLDLPEKVGGVFKITRRQIQYSNFSWRGEI